jgi:hypothetical protein
VTRDAFQRASLRRDFRLLVHESAGQAYEDLFVAIMKRANADFIPVKPHGPFGDRKNDGFDPKTGIYYQVYAPEDIRANTYKALQKIYKDFTGLKQYWDEDYPIREFYFVINDKYRGVYPVVMNQLSRIKKKHKLENAAPLLAADLEEILFELPDDVVFSIIGSGNSLRSTQIVPPVDGELKSSPGFNVRKHVKRTVELPSSNYMKAVIAQIVREICNRPTTEADWQAYIPILEKYGEDKGSIIISRSLIKGIPL